MKGIPPPKRYSTALPCNAFISHIQPTTRRNKKVEREEKVFELRQEKFEQVIKKEGTGEKRKATGIHPPLSSYTVFLIVSFSLLPLLPCRKTDLSPVNMQNTIMSRE